ncbi:MAG: glycogen-binding domain-containing protein [Gemmatimonadota bacterium]|jgi:hypothetical protein
MRTRTVRTLVLTQPALAALLWAPLAAPWSASVSAQVSDLTVEVGASSVLPPTGVDGDAAGFFVAGLRGSRYDLFGTGGYASVLVGRSLDSSTGGNFVSGEVGGAAWRRLGVGWSAGVEGRLFGFGVADPFSYRAAAAEGSVVLRWRRDGLTARLTGLAGGGRSRTEISEVVQGMRRQFTVRDVLVDNLWRYGGTVELLAGSPSVAAGVAGGIHQSAAGMYRSAGLRLVASRGLGALEIRADAWRTPVGNETTGGIAFYIPVGGWSARGMAGKPEPDPLLLAEPGRGSGGLLVGRRILGGTLLPPRRPALHQVVGEVGGVATVRFTVKPPPGARTVALLGDFTLWEPLSMTADGGRWTVETKIRPGTWHFGFLVDGDWYLPDDAPDAVPDEWGRRSATLVIEGEARS